MREGPNFANRHTVLVVDDSPDDIQILNELLGETYEVRIAKNGEQALAAARQKPKPSLILLDVVMPGMDGYEVCARLKAAATTADIPVIFLTAKNQAEEAQLGFDIGGADYITKPILPAVVLARVRTHVYLHLSLDFLKKGNWMA